MLISPRPPVVQQIANDTDEVGGEQVVQMIDRLMSNLQGTLTESTSEEVPLSQEFAELRDYLEATKVFMGPRLVYRLDLPPTLEPVTIPTTLLLQLVENAVKHGLEPLACGGSVEVAARRTEAGVVITVADAALGLPPYRPFAMVPSNSGDFRRDPERWRVVCGRSATVSLTSRHSTGMCAKVTLC